MHSPGRLEQRSGFDASNFFRYILRCLQRIRIPELLLGGDLLYFSGHSDPHIRERRSPLVMGTSAFSKARLLGSGHRPNRS
jgi:hypothetical protein